MAEITAGDPDDWHEVIAPGAFDGIDQDVPLTLYRGGPVIGTAHVTATPAALEVTTEPIATAPDGGPAR